MVHGDERIRARYRVHPSELVLDVGAYEGAFTAEMLAAGAEVVAIEPIPTYASALKARYASRSDVTVLAVALGKADGMIDISLDGDGSSAWGNSNETVAVPLCDAATVVGDRQVALMKINAEGAEFEILERLIESRKIDQVRCLQVQFHRFVPEAAEQRRFIRRELRRTHKCSWNVPWVWEQWVRRS